MYRLNTYSKIRVGFVALFATCIIAYIISDIAIDKKVDQLNDEIESSRVYNKPTKGKKRSSYDMFVYSQISSLVDESEAMKIDRDMGEDKTGFVVTYNSKDVDINNMTMTMQKSSNKLYIKSILIEERQDIYNNKVNIGVR